jgi:hypothetical protein
MNGGARGKKKMLREIFTTAVDEEMDETSEITKKEESQRSERPRSRSRSRSRVTYHSDSDTNTDTDNDSNYSNDSRISHDSRNSNNQQNHDYIVTLGTTVKEGATHHQYQFVDNELEYDIEEFAEKHPEVKDYELVIYRINTLSILPFLEFLFYYENSVSFCKLPYYKHSPKKHIRKECDALMNRLFSSKFRFKGYIHDELTGKCVIFYEKYFRNEHVIPQQLELTKSHNWYWLCSSEIMNHQKYMTLPIDEEAIQFFMAYPLAGVLQRIETSSRSTLQNIEVPAILYYGSTLCYAENTSIYGLKREPIIARFGPFYYFTTLQHSYYWACYHNTSKGSKQTKNAQGGISRYAVFTGHMKTVFQDDDYDVSIVKKYTERKNIFKTQINQYRQTQEPYRRGAYDSIYSYDYTWPDTYDTIYNGLYSAKETIRPVWCVCDYKHFQLLSYYEVITSVIPSSYDPEFTGYKIL